MFVNIPSAILSALGINGNHYALASKLVGRLTDQFRSVNCRRIYGNFICTFSQQFLEIIYSTDTTAYCKRDKYIGSNPSYHINYRISLFAGRCNIEKHQFICSCCIIGFGNLHRITRIAKLHKIYTLYHTSVIYIQAGNNSLCKHLNFPPFQYCRLFRQQQNFQVSSVPICCSFPDGTGRQIHCPFLRKHEYRCCIL